MMIASYLKVTAETDLQRLRTHGEVTLQQVNLCHQQMSVSIRRALLQTALKGTLGSISVT